MLVTKKGVSRVHTVKVFNNNGNAVPTHVEIDGKPLRCREIDYHAEVDHIPTFTFELLALPGIEVNHADICFRYHPESVVESVKILRHELMLHGEVYGGFLESIKSALHDMGAETDITGAAKFILSRIIGE